MGKVHADPYDLVLDNDHDFVSDVLETIKGLSTTHVAGQPSRWHELGNGWLCVDYLDRTAGSSPRWEGTLQRIKNNDLPSRSSPTGGTHALALADHEGLGEHIAFLYDESSGLLWLQRERRVCGKLLFMDYLSTKANVAVFASVRLRKDAIKRAKKLEVIRSVEFGFREGDNASGPIQKRLSRLTDFGAARIDVKISAGRGRTLEPEAKELVEDVVEELENDQIAKAQIRGRYEESDDTDTVIDLIRDRTKMAIKVGDHRRRDPTRLRAAVRDIWLEFRHKV